MVFQGGKSRGSQVELMKQGLRWEKKREGKKECRYFAKKIWRLTQGGFGYFQ